MAVKIQRAQVLAYRVAAHGLARDPAVKRPAELAVFDLGVQDSSAGSARLSLAARLAGPPPADPTADGSLTLVWSHRGAPHLHRTAELPAIAAAGWPRDDEDAAARLGWQRARLTAAGVAGRAAYVETAEAVRATASGQGPMTKGAMSAALTAMVSSSLSAWCRPCGSTHISEQLLRLTALPGGVRLQFGESPLLLAALDGWSGPPDEPTGTDKLITTYLRLLGPGTAADAAGFLGTNRAAAIASWPDGLTEVSVDGRRSWLPDGEVALLHDPPAPPPVRLLPPSDPFLQARDRNLLVPQRAAQKALWRALQSPGALLLGGEIAGTWRAKRGGRDRLDIAVSSFAALTGPQRAGVDDEAQRVAELRGFATAKVGCDVAA